MMEAEGGSLQERNIMNLDEFEPIEQKYERIWFSYKYLSLYIKIIQFLL